MNRQNCESDDTHRFYKYVSEDDLTEGEKKCLNIEKHKKGLKTFVLNNVMQVRYIKIQIMILKLLGETGNEKVDETLMSINRHVRVLRFLSDKIVDD